MNKYYLISKTDSNSNDVKILLKDVSHTYMSHFKMNLYKGTVIKMINGIANKKYNDFVNTDSSILFYDCEIIKIFKDEQEMLNEYSLDLL